MGTAKNLVQPFCTELTLKIEFFGLDTYLFYDSTHYAPINGGLLTYKNPSPYPPRANTYYKISMRPCYYAYIRCVLLPDPSALS